MPAFKIGDRVYLLPFHSVNCAGTVLGNLSPTSASTMYVVKWDDSEITLNSAHELTKDADMGMAPRSLHVLVCDTCGGYAGVDAGIFQAHVSKHCDGSLDIFRYTLEGRV